MINEAKFSFPYYFRQKYKNILVEPAENFTHCHLPKERFDLKGSKCQMCL